MNIKKISKNLYIKTLSQSEKQLYDYIESAVSQINPEDRATIEKVIQEVLSRVKQEITNMNGEFGVISVNGRNGIVTITPNNIGAEPAFNKRSAFNKNFGTEFNTICEGNDPRLSDSRVPLAHKHEAIEIEGLDKMIGFNENIINLEEKAHQHRNKDILDRVSYSGSNDYVDLIKLDHLEHFIDVDIDSVLTHVNRDDIHVTNTEKERWNSKETTHGAQQKASTALENAKTYSNSIKTELLGNASSDYQTLGKIETKLRELTGDSESSTTNIISHIQNSIVHITTEERQMIGTIRSKAEANHSHHEYLQYKPFVSIAEMP